MHNKIRRCLLFLLFLLPAHCWALQIKSFHNYHRLDFLISAQELTHIVVKGDRIQAIRGNEGTYVINLNNNDGTVFIKPTFAYQLQPFSIFITTIQGRTLPLLLMPRQLPSETILIQPEKKVLHRVAVTKQNSSSITLLMTLLQAMIQHRDYNGFIVSSENRILPSPNPAVQIEHITRYTSSTLQGEILRLSNHSTHVLTFPFEQLLLPNTKVLAAESLMLQPGHSLLIYRIQRYE